MTFNLNGIQVPICLYNQYMNDIIDKIFKILPIYENCVLSEGKDFYPYISHLDKLITQFTGSEILFEEKAFLTLTTILIGMQETTNLTQKKVKSLVFHCIDIVSKLKKSGG